MTPDIQHVGEGTTKRAGAAAAPKEPVQGTAFELLLNLQVTAKIPELTRSERGAKQLDARERRDDQRSDRTTAQDRRGDGTSRRSESRPLAHDAGRRNPVENARANSDLNGPVSRGNARFSDTARVAIAPQSGLPLGTGSPPLTTNAGAAASGENATLPDSASSTRQSGAFNALLGGHAATLRGAASSTASANSAVSAAKPAGSGTPPHLMTSARIAGRFNQIRVTRGRTPSPSGRARPFHLEQQKVLAQVGRGLAAALKKEGGVVTLRLRPEVLGDLKIKLEMNNGKVGAVFRAENESARQLLESGLDALRTSLEAKGLRVDTLHVEPPDQSGHTRQEGSNDEPRNREHPSGGDREHEDDGDRPHERPGKADENAGGDPPHDAEASDRPKEASDARIAEDSHSPPGDALGPDEVMVRVRLDAVA